MPDAAEMVADACEKHHYDDWYIALLHMAMEETGDLTEAIEVAGATYEMNPKPPPPPRMEAN